MMLCVHVLLCGCRDAGGWKIEAYSDPISVDAVCDACEGRYLAFVFHNNAHNVQLLLPMTVDIDVEPWVRTARVAPHLRFQYQPTRTSSCVSTARLPSKSLWQLSRNDCSATRTSALSRWLTDWLAVGRGSPSLQ